VNSALLRNAGHGRVPKKRNQEGYRKLAASTIRLNPNSKQSEEKFKEIQKRMNCSRFRKRAKYDSWRQLEERLRFHPHRIGSNIDFSNLWVEDKAAWQQEFIQRLL